MEHMKTHDTLGKFLKEGARPLLTQAVEAEWAELLAQHTDVQIDGKHAVVRNNSLPARTLQTDFGEVPFKIPKAGNGSGLGVKFNSKLVPLCLKRTKNVEEFMPRL